MKAQKIVALHIYLLICTPPRALKDIEDIPAPLTSYSLGIQAPSPVPGVARGMPRGELWADTVHHSLRCTRPTGDVFMACLFPQKVSSARTETSACFADCRRRQKRCCVRACFSPRAWLFAVRGSGAHLLPQHMQELSEAEYTVPITP